MEKKTIDDYIALGYKETGVCFAGDKIYMKGSHRIIYDEKKQEVYFQYHLRPNEYAGLKLYETPKEECQTTRYTDRYSGTKTEEE